MHGAGEDMALTGSPREAAFITLYGDILSGYYYSQHGRDISRILLLLSKKFEPAGSPDTVCGRAITSEKRKRKAREKKHRSTTIQDSGGVWSYVAAVMY